jgi:hypothetical protein
MCYVNCNQLIALELLVFSEKAFDDNETYSLLS